MARRLDDSVTINRHVRILKITPKVVFLLVNIVKYKQFNNHNIMLIDF